MDLVSRKELSKDASIESVDDWRASMSTSVARDLVHDLVELVAIRRPTVQSANEKAIGYSHTHHAVRTFFLVSLLV